MKNKIKQFLKQIKFKSKIKITFDGDDKNKYNIHCKNCGKFKGKSHKCDFPPRKVNKKYRCGRCKKYFPYKNFQKDSTKKFGINTRCKKCRSETGNGNKTRKRLNIKW